MANGWRPKRNCRANFSNVFPINYNSDLVDEIIKELFKSKGKEKDKLVYLGMAGIIKDQGGIILTVCMKIGPTLTPIPSTRKWIRSFRGGRDFPITPN